MSKARASWRCKECGAVAPKWAGRCGGCGAWGSLDEVVAVGAGARRPDGGAEACLLSEVSVEGRAALPTGVDELDRALGGGLVPGAVTLVGGEPGIGKSTLLLQVASAVGAQQRRVLYVSAEESGAQLRRRAERLGLAMDEVWIHAETALERIVAEIDRLGPEVVLVDSIQTVAAAEVTGVPGSVSQVRECAQVLLERARSGSIATVLVGHVTKDGAIAGPRTLEHLVDTVLSFEGDRHQGLRFLRAVKHRFGSTGEPGVFEMTAEGLVAVADPSGIFLADRCRNMPGSVVVPVLDGRRPMLVELQALVVPSNAPSPRRAAQGIDSNRLAVLSAVLERRCGVPVLAAEAYVSVVGGVRVAEPGIDLGLALALASSRLDRPLPDDLVVCGEVGLAGELRQVGQLERRLDEAARLGYRRALVPASTPPGSARVELVRAASITEAMKESGLGRGLRVA